MEDLPETKGENKLESTLKYTDKRRRKKHNYNYQTIEALHSYELFIDILFVVTMTNNSGAHVIIPQLPALAKLPIIDRNTTVLGYIYYDLEHLAGFNRNQPNYINCCLISSHITI